MKPKYLEDFKNQEKSQIRKIVIEYRTYFIKKWYEYFKTIHKDRFDPIDTMIFDEGLRIQKLFFDTDLDLILVVLNNKNVLKEPISKFRFLANATIDQLNNYEISRTGVHWPQLDEDLSLRGFLKTAMLATVHQGSKVA